MINNITTFLKKLVKMEIYWQILIGIVLGLAYGLLFADYILYIEWMGKLFMNGLKMIIVPLTFSSIISGVANIGSMKSFGRMGVTTILLFMLSSLFAIVTGQVLVNIFEPGKGIDLHFAKDLDVELHKDSFISLIINIVPTNVLKALIEADMLAIIFSAMLIGFYVTKIPAKYSELFTDFANAAFELMMRVTGFVLSFAPLGIMAIIAVNVTKYGNDLTHIGAGLMKYSFVVIGGIAIHYFITLPLMLTFLAKVNPIKHLKAMRNALITAFTTCSSGATLPVTIKSAEENAGISHKTTSFVYPLGATINMDGTALYECVAAIFIAQAYGLELSFSQQILITFTALLASIGAAAVPMAGLIMLSIVLNAINLPLEGVGIILVVDRFLDMFRTSTNVWSDCTCAAIVASREGEILKTSFKFKPQEVAQ